MSEMHGDGFYSPIVLELVRTLTRQEFSGAKFMAIGWLYQGMNTEEFETMQQQIDALNGALAAISEHDQVPDNVKDLSKSSLKVLGQMKKSLTNIQEIDKYHAEFLRDVIRYSTKAQNDTKIAKSLQALHDISQNYFIRIDKLHSTLQHNLAENFPSCFSDANEIVNKYNKRKEDET